MCPAVQASVNSTAQPGASTNCAQQSRHPLILQHGLERPQVVPSSPGTRSFYSTAWGVHKLCPAVQAPVNSTARPAAIRFRSGSFLASTWRQLGANMIRLWIRLWEESPKETVRHSVRNFNPAAVRRDPPGNDSEAFFLTSTRTLQLNRC